MASILLKDNFPLPREELMHRLKERGIDSRPFYYPIHTMPPYQDDTLKLPVAEDISRRGINLPSAVTLTEADIQRIVSAIRQLSL
jgi:perosamine synthetase